MFISLLSIVFRIFLALTPSLFILLGHSALCTREICSNYKDDAGFSAEVTGQNPNCTCMVGQSYERIIKVSLRPSMSWKTILDENLCDKAYPGSHFGGWRNKEQQDIVAGLIGSSDCYIGAYRQSDAKTWSWAGGRWKGVKFITEPDLTLANGFFVKWQKGRSHRSSEEMIGAYKREGAYDLPTAVSTDCFICVLYTCRRDHDCNDNSFHATGNWPNCECQCDTRKSTYGPRCASLYMNSENDVVLRYTADRITWSGARDVCIRSKMYFATVRNAIQWGAYGTEWDTAIGDNNKECWLSGTKEDSTWKWNSGNSPNHGRFFGDVVPDFVQWQGSQYHKGAALTKSGSNIVLDRLESYIPQNCFLCIKYKCNVNDDCNGHATAVASGFWPDCLCNFTHSNDIILKYRTYASTLSWSQAEEKCKGVDEGHSFMASVRNAAQRSAFFEDGVDGCMLGAKKEDDNWIWAGGRFSDMVFSIKRQSVNDFPNSIINLDSNFYGKWKNLGLVASINGIGESDTTNCYICMMHICNIAEDCSGGATKVKGYWPDCHCECSLSRYGPRCAEYFDNQGDRVLKITTSRITWKTARESCLYMNYRLGASRNAEQWGLYNSNFTTQSNQMCVMASMRDPTVTNDWIWSTGGGPLANITFSRKVHFYVVYNGAVEWSVSPPSEHTVASHDPTSNKLVSHLGYKASNCFYCAIYKCQNVDCGNTSTGYASGQFPHCSCGITNEGSPTVEYQIRCSNNDLTQSAGQNLCRDIGPSWGLAAIRDVVGQNVINAMILHQNYGRVWLGGENSTSGNWTWKYSRVKGTLFHSPLEPCSYCNWKTLEANGTFHECDDVQGLTISRGGFLEAVPQSYCNSAAGKMPHCAACERTLCYLGDCPTGAIFASGEYPYCHCTFSNNKRDFFTRILTSEGVTWEKSQELCTSTVGRHLATTRVFAQFNYLKNHSLSEGCWMGGMNSNTKWKWTSGRWGGRLFSESTSVIKTFSQGVAWDPNEDLYVDGQFEYPALSSTTALSSNVNTATLDCYFCVEFNCSSYDDCYNRAPHDSIVADDYWPNCSCNSCIEGFQGDHCEKLTSHKEVTTIYYSDSAITNFEAEAKCRSKNAYLAVIRGDSEWENDYKGASHPYEQPIHLGVVLEEGRYVGAAGRFKGQVVVSPSIVTKFGSKMYKDRSSLNYHEGRTLVLYNGSVVSIGAGTRTHHYACTMYKCSRKEDCNGHGEPQSLEWPNCMCQCDTNYTGDHCQSFKIWNDNITRYTTSNGMPVTASEAQNECKKLNATLATSRGEKQYKSLQAGSCWIGGEAKQGSVLWHWQVSPYSRFSGLPFSHGTNILWTYNFYMKWGNINNDTNEKRSIWFSDPTDSGLALSGATPASPNKRLYCYYCVEYHCNIDEDCHGNGVSVSGIFPNCSCVCPFPLYGSCRTLTATITISATLSLSDTVSRSNTPTPSRTTSSSQSLNVTVTQSMLFTPSVTIMTTTITRQPPSTTTLTTSLSTSFSTSSPFTKSFTALFTHTVSSAVSSSLTITPTNVYPDVITATFTKTAIDTETLLPRSSPTSTRTLLPPPVLTPTRGGPTLTNKTKPTPTSTRKEEVRTPTITHANKNIVHTPTQTVLLLEKKSCLPSIPPSPNATGKPMMVSLADLSSAPITITGLIFPISLTNTRSSIRRMELKFDGYENSDYANYAGNPRGLKEVGPLQVEYTVKEERANTTILDVTLPVVPKLAVYRDERVVLNVIFSYCDLKTDHNGRPFAIQELLSEVNTTILLRLTLHYKSEALQEFTSAQIAGLGTATAVTVYGASDVRVVGAIGHWSCASPLQRQMFGSVRTLGPFALSNTLEGAFLGSLIVLGGSGLLWLALAWFVSIRCTTTIGEGLSSVRFGLWVGLLYALHSGLVFISMQMVVRNESVSSVVLGVIGLVAFLPVIVWAGLMGFFTVARSAWLVDYRDGAVSSKTLPWLFYPAVTIIPDESRNIFGPTIAWMHPSAIWCTLPVWSGTFTAILTAFPLTDATPCAAMAFVLGGLHILFAIVCIVFRPTRILADHLATTASFVVTATSFILTGVARMRSVSVESSARGCAVLLYIQVALCILRTIIAIVWLVAEKAMVGTRPLQRVWGRRPTCFGCFPLQLEEQEALFAKNGATLEHPGLGGLLVHESQEEMLSLPTKNPHQPLKERGVSETITRSSGISDASLLRSEDSASLGTPSADRPATAGSRQRVTETSSSSGLGSSLDDSLFSDSSSGISAAPKKGKAPVSPGSSALYSSTSSSNSSDSLGSSDF